MTVALATRVRTMLALGVRSVARVMAYRAAVRLRLHPVLRLAPGKVSGSFFRSSACNGTPDDPGGWDAEGRLFGWKTVPLADGPPDWFVNYFNGARAAGASSPWHQLPDFDPALGDIKTIWEWSRFEFALAAALRNDAASIARLNAWLADWCNANPAYRGPNWKCGQEASLRTLRLLMALLVTGRLLSPEPGLAGLIERHLQRIAPTTSYARGQDNNHGTSEAAALFAGGAWLEATTGDRRHPWARKGRNMLQERVAALVGEDGGFSQYSTTYHRLMLDTLSVAEIIRARLGEPEFSSNFRHRAAAATQWLYTLTAPETGDAPNLGQNDSSELLATGWTANRDFRPSVELASRLFCHASAYGDDHGAGRLADRLGVPAPAEQLALPRSTVFTDYGLAVLIRGGSRATLNFPHFRFRPSQADLLHVDYWRDGRPLLRDAGTYSYADPVALDAYSSVAAHNTVQFDNSDQMPRLGRFLYGDWPRTHLIERLAEGDATSVAAAYENRAGHRHARRIELRDDSLLVRDTVSGFTRSAVARWRLPEGDWRIVEGGAVTSSGYRVSVSADNGVVPVLAIGPGLEARHYLQAESCIVLSILVERPCSFEARFELGDGA